MLGKKGGRCSPRAGGGVHLMPKVLRASASRVQSFGKPGLVLGWVGSEGDLQLLPTRMLVKGPHQPAEWGAVLHTLQQLLQPLPGLAYTLTALGQLLSRQVCDGAGRGDNAIELTEAVPCPPDLLLELGRETLETGGQGAVGHMELLDESTDSGQSP